MKTRIDLGAISPKRASVTRRGGVGAFTYNLDIEELSIDLKANRPEAVLAEAGDKDKNEIARDASNFLGVEPYAAIYLVGPWQGFPVKVGITDDPRSRISAIQCGNHERLDTHAIFWTRLADAQKIEQRVLKNAKASGLHERGEWLTATAITAVDMVMEATEQEDAELFTSAMAIENRGRMLRALDAANSERRAQDEAA